MPRSSVYGPSVRSGTIGSVSMRLSSEYSAIRPERAGMRTIVSGRMISPPNRSPICWPRNPMVAIAAMPRSRLVTPSVPQFMDGVTSSSAQTSSSRSAMVSRTWGVRVRAVTAQSIFRTSSPGT